MGLGVSGLALHSDPAWAGPAYPTVPERAVNLIIVI